jgi:hypothetical protein
LPAFLKPGLSSTGKKIIEACLSGATVEDYISIIPMNYKYSFFSVNENEENNENNYY